MSKRISLKDKEVVNKGKGVDSFFNAPETENNLKQETKKPTKKIIERKNKPHTVTFSLYEKHQDFLDSFVTAGKKEFRHDEIGSGAISKSAVFQMMLEILEEDKNLQTNILTRLRRKVELEGSPHNPYKTQ